MHGSLLTEVRQTWAYCVLHVEAAFSSMRAGPPLLVGPIWRKKPSWDFAGYMSSPRPSGSAGTTLD